MINDETLDYLRIYFNNLEGYKLDDKEFLEYRCLDSGNIDSFEIVSLIIDIETRFDVSIDADDTESDEFRYIEGLAKIIDEKSALHKR